MAKKRLSKNQQALHDLMQEYADKGVDVSYINIPKTITQKFLQETRADLEQRFTAQQHDIVDTIKQMLYDLPNSRYVYNRSHNKMNEISLESFYYKAIGMLQDNLQEFGKDYYNYLKENESKIIESLEVITGDSEDSRIRTNISQALNILSYNNMSKEMEIVTNNWLETLANYNEE